MSLATPFSISIVGITALTLLGLPIGHAMIAGSALYLLLAGQDLGTVAEQLLNGMYTSWVLLAVPLFILAAEFYRQLQNPSTTKAGALQRAQQKLLEDPIYQHPAYWAPFLLLNNWL